MSQQGKAYTEAEWLARAVDIDRIMSDEGLSLTAACARLGINKMSVYNAREKFEAFNASVELSLGKRQEFLELQLMEYVKGNRRGSPAAAIFALKNAAPKDWRETYQLESKTTVENNYDLTKLTDEELIQLQNLLDSERGTKQIEYQELTDDGRDSS